MLSQSFGDAVVTNEADIINTLEIHPNCGYFATGDRGGRIVIFRTSGDKVLKDGSNRVVKSWTPFFQFQSHEPDFDYLKSADIEEKINCIRFGPSVNSNLSILSCNDKTIRLWKVMQLPEYSTCDNATNIENSPQHKRRPELLTLPEKLSSSVTYASLKKSYTEAHSYNIHSLVVSNDQETFYSCDDLRILSWKYERNDVCFNLIDLKPDKIEELSELITCCRIHPKYGHLLMYGTSKGTLRLVDNRQSALCDTHGTLFHDSSSQDNGKSNKTKTASMSSQLSYCHEVAATISDINFNSDGNEVVIRDYMSLKLWDIRKPSQSILTIPVHEQLTPYFIDLLETDCLFDKFLVNYSANNQKLVTGSYSNTLHVYDKVSGKRENIITLPTPSPIKSNRQSIHSEVDDSKILKEIKIPRGKVKGVTEIRGDLKIINCKFTPQDSTVMVGGQAGLYIYQI